MRLDLRTMEDQDIRKQLDVIKRVFAMTEV